MEIKRRSSALFSARVKKDFYRMETIFKEMENAQTLDLYAYNIMISSFAHNETLHQKMFAYFHKLKAAGFQPDVFTYNSIFTSFLISGKMGKLEIWLKNMNADGITPTPKTWSLLLKIVDKWTPSQFHLYVQKMLEESIPIDKFHLSIILGNYLKTNRKEDFELMWSKLLSIDSTIDIHLLNIRLEFLFNRNNLFPETLELLKNMRERNIKPDTYTFNSILKFLSNEITLAPSETRLNQVKEVVSYFLQFFPNIIETDIPISLSSKSILHQWLVETMRTMYKNDIPFDNVTTHQFVRCFCSSELIDFFCYLNQIEPNCSLQVHPFHFLSVTTLYWEEIESMKLVQFIIQNVHQLPSPSIWETSTAWEPLYFHCSTKGIISMKCQIEGAVAARFPQVGEWIEAIPKKKRRYKNKEPPIVL